MKFINNPLQILNKNDLKVNEDLNLLQFVIINKNNKIYRDKMYKFMKGYWRLSQLQVKIGKKDKIH